MNCQMCFCYFLGQVFHEKYNPKAPFREGSPPKLPQVIWHSVTFTMTTNSTTAWASDLSQPISLTFYKLVTVFAPVKISTKRCQIYSYSRQDYADKTSSDAGQHPDCQEKESRRKKKISYERIFEMVFIIYLSKYFSITNSQKACVIQ